MRGRPVNVTQNPANKRPPSSGIDKQDRSPNSKGKETPTCPKTTHYYFLIRRFEGVEKGRRPIKTKKVEWKVY